MSEGRAAAMATEYGHEDFRHFDCKTWRQQVTLIKAIQNGYIPEPPVARRLAVQTGMDLNSILSGAYKGAFYMGEER